MQFGTAIDPMGDVSTAAIDDGAGIGEGAGGEDGETLMELKWKEELKN
jgi:hypothetical protein